MGIVWRNERLQALAQRPPLRLCHLELGRPCAGRRVPCHDDTTPFQHKTHTKPSTTDLTLKHSRESTANCSTCLISQQRRTPLSLCLPVRTKGLMFPKSCFRFSVTPLNC